MLGPPSWTWLGVVQARDNRTATLKLGGRTFASTTGTDEGMGAHIMACRDGCSKGKSEWPLLSQNF